MGGFDLGFLFSGTNNGGLFFFPREEVPSAFIVPPGTKFWLFFSYEGKTSLGAQYLKTLIPKLIVKAHTIPTVHLGL